MTINPIQEIPRDRWGRPMVVPPGGTKPVGYQRCTTFVSVLEDTYNLSKWQQRMVAIGLADSPDLMLQLASTDKDDKKAINTICESSMERAKAHAAATIGTALHALTERMDRGQEVGVVPEAYMDDLKAYEDATKDLTAVHIEQFTVLDDLKIGGTPDRVVEYDGRLMIADLKTGSVEWGMGKICMQLAVYAHSQIYSFETTERTPLGDVDQDTAIVIHLPAGTGKAELIEIDIAAGWEAVQLATKVKDWRARKNLSRPLNPSALTLPASVPEAPAESTSSSPRSTSPEYQALEEKIATAINVDDLRTLWAEHQNLWDQALTDLASARTALLENRVVASTATAKESA